jgi:hypothetical protein
LHETNHQLYDALKNFDVVKDEIRSSLEHINKARGVTDAIHNGVFK